MSADPSEPSASGDQSGPIRPGEKFIPEIGVSTLEAEAAAHMEGGGQVVRAVPPDVQASLERAEGAARAMPEQFRAFEELLARTLEKVRLETKGQQLFNRLNPEQRDATLLMIETLTKLFEGYRSLSYQMQDMWKGYVENRRSLDELREVLVQAVKQGYLVKRTDA